ncbi:MAG: type II secretion system F family protein [Microthrixaceae bacterium]
MKLPGAGRKRADSLALFARQFATMAGSGTPLLRSLTILARQSKDTSLRAAITAVRADIENGEPLSVAMSHRPDWFGEFVVSMVEAGERAGALSSVLDRLALSTERAAEIRRKVRGALAYPVAISVMIVLTVTAMLVFLVPTFTGIYEDLGGTLPLPTQIITGISGFLTSNLVLIVLSVLLCLVVFRRWARTASGRRTVDRWKLRVPVFGGLVSRSSLARFSRSLAVLVSSEVPIADAMSVAATTAGNVVLTESVADVVRAVNAGTRISTAMADQPVFSELVVQMIAVGEETGSLEELLDRVAELYDQEVTATVESLTSALEPILLMVMGLVVGGILLAVYLPMFGAVDLIR